MLGKVKIVYSVHSKDVLVQGHGKAVEKGQNPKINRVGLALSLVIGKVKGKSKNLIRKMKIRKTRPKMKTLSWPTLSQIFAKRNKSGKNYI